MAIVLLLGLAARLSAQVATPAPPASCPGGAVETISVQLSGDTAPLEDCLDTWPETAVNGGFDADTDWTKGTGWTISGGVASRTTTGFPNESGISQPQSFVIGAHYVVRYTVTTISAGQIRGSIPGQAGIYRNTAGTFSDVLQAAAPSGDLVLYGQGFIGSVDNVSIERFATGECTLRGAIEKGKDTNGGTGVVNIDVNPDVVADLGSSISLTRPYCIDGGTVRAVSDIQNGLNITADGTTLLNMAFDQATPGAEFQNAAVRINGGNNNELWNITSAPLDNHVVRIENGGSNNLIHFKDYGTSPPSDDDELTGFSGASPVRTGGGTGNTVWLDQFWVPASTEPIDVGAAGSTTSDLKPVISKAWVDFRFPLPGAGGLSGSCTVDRPGPTENCHDLDIINIELSVPLSAADPGYPLTLQPYAIRSLSGERRGHATCWDTNTICTQPIQVYTSTDRASGSGAIVMTQPGSTDPAIGGREEFTYRTGGLGTDQFHEGVSAIAIDSDGQGSEFADIVPLWRPWPPILTAEYDTITIDLDNLAPEIVYDVLANDEDYDNGGRTERNDLDIFWVGTNVCTPDEPAGDNCTNSPLPISSQFGTLTVQSRPTAEGTRDVLVYSPVVTASGQIGFWYGVRDTGDFSPELRRLSSQTNSAINLNRRPQAQDMTIVMDFGSDTTVVVPLTDLDQDLSFQPLRDRFKLDTAATQVQPVGGFGGTLDVDLDAFTFTYSAPSDPDSAGQYQFEYWGFDHYGTQSRVATVTFDVNVDAFATNDTVAIDEDETTVIDVLDNDVVVGTVAPGEFAVTDGPCAGQPCLGTIGGVNELTGEITYIPFPDSFGIDQFTYEVCSQNVVGKLGKTTDSIECPVDDGKSNLQANVFITISPLPDPPVAIRDTFDVTEDVELNVGAPGVLANDYDPDGDPIEAELLTSTVNGSLTFNADGSFSYTPNENYAGRDSLQYRVGDNPGDLNSGLLDTTWTILEIGVVNDAPIAVPDTIDFYADQKIHEETGSSAFTLSAPGVLANDIDEGVLTAQITPRGLRSVLNPEVDPEELDITFVFSPDGSFLLTSQEDWWVHDEAEDTLYTFSYFAFDSEFLVSDSAVVTIRIHPPWLATDESYNVDEDETLTVPAPGVLANDVGPLGNPLIAELDSANFTPFRLLQWSFESDGSFSATPRSNASGFTVNFPYYVLDGDRRSFKANAEVFVNQVPDPPIAIVDNYEVQQGTALVVDAPGVLDNDIDPDDLFVIDTLSAALVDDVTSGTLVLDAEGGFTYTPADDFLGDVTFTYAAIDRIGLADTTTVTITVTDAPVDNPPVAVADTFTVDEDTELSVPPPGVLSNDSDPEDGPVTAVLVSGTVNGTVELESDGSFHYTPDGNYFGADSLRYHAYDGVNSSDTVTVLLQIQSINDLPQATNDAYLTEQDAVLTVDAPGVLENDSDVETETLTANLTSPVSEGLVTLNPDGGFTYEPPEGFFGQATFEYSSEDADGGLDTALVTIVVTEVMNQRPVVVSDTFAVDEDETLQVAAPGVLGNDEDPEEEALTARLASQPQNGSLEFSPDGSFEFAPDDDFFGTAMFAYIASDGAQDSDTAFVVIEVAPVNDRPSAVSDVYEGLTDSTLTVDAPGVLANDSDVDGDELNAALITAPAEGTLDLLANGGFVYVPPPGFSAEDSFVYVADDGNGGLDTALVTILVSSGDNEPPVAVADTFSVDEDATLLVDAPGVLENDSDPEESPLSAVLVVDVRHGTALLNNDGSLSYTPARDFNGLDSLIYRASDGVRLSDETIVYLDVAPVNDRPSASSDAYSVAVGGSISVGSPGILSNDVDVDGDQLTAALIQDAGAGLLNLQANGSFTFDAPEMTGPVTFVYAADDGNGARDSAAVTLNVFEGENAPPVSLPDAYDATEDVVLVIDPPGVLSNDVDPEGGPLTAAVVAEPEHGAVLLGSDGGFTYTPEADFFGSDAFTYRALDGQGAAGGVTTVVVAVASVNDRPIAADDAAEVNQGGSVVINLLSNDLDADGDSLRIVRLIPNEAATVDSDSLVTYSPPPGFTGTDTFQYVVGDGRSGRDTAQVSVSVIEVASMFTVVELGTLGGASSWAFDVNEDGVVVGAALNEQGVPRAVRWIDGQITDLGTLGGPGSQAHAVSGAGVVVGLSQMDNGAIQAFRTDANGLEGLGWLGGTLSAAYDIDDDGGVAGTSSMSDGSMAPFIWNGAMIFVGIPGVSSGEARGVNASGTVVGFAGEGASLVAFKGPVPGTRSTLDGSPGWALGINQAGQAVGAIVMNGAPIATMWEPDGTPVQIGAGEALAVNDNGVVVGTSATDAVAKGSTAFVPADPIARFKAVTGEAAAGKGTASAAVADAFLWANGTLRVLSEVIDDPTWLLEEAWGVNNRQEIVGVGLKDGNVRGFLLRPVSAAPAVEPDSVDVIAGTSIDIDVLANDAHGGELRLARVDHPRNGSAQLIGPNLIRYSADPGFIGPDRFEYVATDGVVGFSRGSVRVQVHLSIEKPDVFSLEGVFPNPARSQATFLFSIPETAPVRIALFNVLGQPAQVVVDETMPVGVHRVEYSLNHLASGIYLYRVTAGSSHATGRFVILR